MQEKWLKSNYIQNTNSDRSHVLGQTFPDIWRRTIPDLFKETVRTFSDSDAAIFVEQQIRWTWADLDKEIDALALGLLEIGVARGDRVGIWAPNRYEWVLTQFATARLGAILVTINPAYRSSELEYVLNKVSCSVLITADKFKSSDYLRILQSLLPELNSDSAGRLQAKAVPSLRSIIRMGDEKTLGMFNFGSIIDNGRDKSSTTLDDITKELSPDDPINIQFTSGTTGSPKGATLTHVNIVNNGRFAVYAQDLDETDRLCIPVPLYHCFGMVLAALGCVATATAMIYPGEAFDPDTCLRTIQEEKCTSIYGVPTMFVGMLQHPEFDSFDFSSLRTGIMAGAPCPIEIMRECVAKMNLREITIAYGMTETSPVSFQTSKNDLLEKRVSTVGKIHPHVECKIINKKGHVVERGIQGELCTRGYSVMQGYWDDPGRTAESIDKDGWMHSGDLAIIDKEGYCNITGRVKDMVIRGGENIYPREVEEYLHQHPNIQDVQVFGVPDTRLGEEVCAWIVLKSGATETDSNIRSFCNDKIAHYKIPRYIRFKNELPMTVTGKPQKFKMRDCMIEELNLKQKTDSAAI